MNVTVLGDGAFGTAFATLLAHNGHQVTLWCYNKNVAEYILNNHINTKYLPNVQLKKNIIPTTSLEKALRNDFIFEAIPIAFMRSTLEQCKNYVQKNQHWILLSKGIEQKKLLLPSHIIKDIFSENISCTVLSGPSYAYDLAIQQPTKVMLAGQKELCKEISALLTNTYFSLETSEDIIGVQLVGALKNCIAVGVGLLDGAGYGANTQILFIMHMLEEIKIILHAYNCSEKTMYSFAGIGDIILTCFGKQSRNYKFGQLIGRGNNFEKTIQALEIAPEGINTLQSVQEITQKHMLKLQLLDALHATVFEKSDINKLTNILCK